MARLYSAADIQSAYLLQGLLQRAGIDSFIHNEYAQGGMGEIPFTHTYPEIWLQDENDRARALAIIAEFEAQDSSASDITCPHCGETNPSTFESCWHCRKPLS